jgi:(1->4)-alpha-D-glucan 1-alpha-D-glucosylmutase
MTEKVPQYQAPSATYRLQLGTGCTFEDARGLIPYLQALGISHLYLSPCLKAAAGSLHGYDVVDHSQLNPELGGERGFRKLTDALRAAGLGLVLDIVPNHMAADGLQNPAWRAVLANGPRSRFAGFFDIRWDTPDAPLRGKVLVPVLGEPLADCLKKGLIRLARSPAGVHVRYFEHDLPVAPAAWLELARTAAGASGIPSLTQWSDALPAVPQAEAQKALATILSADPRATAVLDAALDAVNAEPLELGRFLDRQHYRLVFWREAAQRINYRRFFDINRLVGVCVEKDDVFAAVHALPLAWVRQGRVAGLRVDHPDGLRDPTGYLERLRAEAPGAWIVVEKILEPSETLDPRWPVAGTTGYDFLNRACGLFVDPGGEAALSRLYREFTGEPDDYPEVVRQKKRRVLETSFASELSHLAGLLVSIGGRRALGPAAAAQNARECLRELIAALPVYRTYIQPATGAVAPHDRSILEQALAEAKQRAPQIPAALWQLVEGVLLLRIGGTEETDFVLRFQQLSGPAAAKGVEDTAFYCFNRLIGLNEVGGNPGVFGVSVEAFHEFCGHIQSSWPLSMRAVATHDTKRGEDARLRICMLSGVPERWAAAVERWSRMNAGLKRDGLPEANSEYFLYQTLVGAWPIDDGRLRATMLKAAREAKTHTSWTDPDPRYEAILQSFVASALANPDFIADFSTFLAPVALAAETAGLSLALIHCTAPGIPDIYQGAELWNLSQVDPDNRRPVDFGRLRKRIGGLDALSCEDILARHAEGLPKLFVLRQALAARRSHPRVFGPRGDYRPLEAQGAGAGCVVAFERGGRAVTVAPLRGIGLTGAWGDTAIGLPEGDWVDAITGEPCPGGLQRLRNVLARFPVALLMRKGGRQ